MLKDQADSLIKDALTFIGPMLKHARAKGRCRFCGAARGVQHDKDCYVWPLVEWRGNYHKLEDD